MCVCTCACVCVCTYSISSLGSNFVPRSGIRYAQSLANLSDMSDEPPRKMPQLGTSGRCAGIEPRALQGSDATVMPGYASATTAVGPSKVGILPIRILEHVAMDIVPMTSFPVLLRKDSMTLGKTRTNVWATLLGAAIVIGSLVFEVVIETEGYKMDTKCLSIPGTTTVEDVRGLVLRSCSDNRYALQFLKNCRYKHLLLESCEGAMTMSHLVFKGETEAERGSSRAMQCGLLSQASKRRQRITFVIDLV